MPTERGDLLATDMLATQQVHVGPPCSRQHALHHAGDTARRPIPGYRPGQDPVSDRRSALITDRIPPPAAVEAVFPEALFAAAAVPAGDERAHVGHREEPAAGVQAQRPSHGNGFPNRPTADASGGARQGAKGACAQGRMPVVWQWIPRSSKGQAPAPAQVLPSSPRRASRGRRSARARSRVRSPAPRRGRGWARASRGTRPAHGPRPRGPGWPPTRSRGRPPGQPGEVGATLRECRPAAPPGLRLTPISPA